MLSRPEKRSTKPVNAVEVSKIPDVYADGAADVEIIGDGTNVRIIYYVMRGPLGNQQAIVACKLIMPRTAISLARIWNLLNRQLTLQTGQIPEDAPFH